jgi:hypothetical protein
VASLSYLLRVGALWWRLFFPGHALAPFAVFTLAVSMRMGVGWWAFLRRSGEQAEVAAAGEFVRRKAAVVRTIEHSAREIERAFDGLF